MVIIDVWCNGSGKQRFMLLEAFRERWWEEAECVFLLRGIVSLHATLNNGNTGETTNAQADIYGLMPTHTCTHTVYTVYIHKGMHACKPHTHGPTPPLYRYVSTQSDGLHFQTKTPFDPILFLHISVLSTCDLLCSVWAVAR